MTTEAATGAARTFVVLGALSMAVAVACGAFGAHGLKGRLATELLAVWHTGVEYHVYHSLGLVATGLLAPRMPGKMLQWAGWLLAAGIVLFSGSLYALALSGIRGFGTVAPFGGTAFIAGWVVLAAAALRGARPTDPQPR